MKLKKSCKISLEKNRNPIPHIGNVQKAKKTRGGVSVNISINDGFEHLSESTAKTVQRIQEKYSIHNKFGIIFPE